MLKNRIYLLTTVNAILIVGLFFFLCVKSFYDSPKIVYVDNMKLFDGFYMTKEMKKVAEKQFGARKAILDSLYSKIQSGKITESEKISLTQTFMKGKEELESFNQNFAVEESTKIWSRIDGYVSDFTKENNYELIIGSENTHDVLYATENSDITAKLLFYINKKYEGVK